MSQPVLVRKGALSFKGGHKRVQRPSSDSTQKRMPDPAQDPLKKQKTTPAEEVPSFQCDGRIVANGTTVQGMETRFKEQLDPGDVIIVLHPQSLSVEERIVTNILSQRSLIVHSAFSSDFMTTSEFAVRKESEKLKAAAAQKTNAERVKKEEQTAEDSVDNKTITVDEALQEELKRKLESEKKIFTYREKIGTYAYRNVSVEVNQNMTREDLLDMQQKKVHDKYC